MTLTRRRTRRPSRAAACGSDAPAAEPVVRDSAGVTIVENAPGAEVVS